MEPPSPTSPPVLAKKIWKMVRLMLFMIRKGISESKLMGDLHNLMMKRGKVAGKAIGNLMFHPHSRKSQDPHLPFIRPGDYEFSCNNSPAAAFLFNLTAKKTKHQSAHPSTVTHDEDITGVAAVQKMLEMLNNEITEAASPVLPGLGFGRSPMVRQLRITDSPFPLKDGEEEDNHHVDKEADEFIQKFYEKLRLQRSKSTSKARKSSMLSRTSSCSTS